MTDITVLQMPLFKKAYKKLRGPAKIKVKEAIQAIIKEPTIGQEKKGDLRGGFVYKFKYGAQQFLLAYEWCPRQRILLTLGVHENFYRDLKR